MTSTLPVEATTPSAVIDRVSLVLDSFDGPGRLTLAQVYDAPGCRGRRHTACSTGWFSCAGCAESAVTTNWACAWSNSVRWPCTRTASTRRRPRCCTNCTAPLDWWFTRRSRRHRRGLPRQDRRSDGRGHPDPRGGRQPAHWRAVGKAILAYGQDPETVRPERPQNPLLDHLAHQLAMELAKVRAHGVAFDREESLPGFGVSRPPSVAGDAVAAVSVCGPMTDDVRSAVAAPVRMTAMEFGATSRTARNAWRRRCSRRATAASPGRAVRVSWTPDCRPDRRVGRRFPAGAHHDARPGPRHDPVPVSYRGRPEPVGRRQRHVDSRPGRDIASGSTAR